MQKKVPVEKGKSYEIDITGFGTGGEGVGRYAGFTVFVPYALPGERVVMRVNEVRKNFARADIVSIERASSDRVEPACPLYYECGGCQLQHLSYEAQLAAKRQQVRDALSHIGHQTAIEVLPTLGAADPWNYRNKMQFPIGMGRGKKKGHIVIGCFAKGSHDIIDTSGCLIQREGNNEILRAVREAVEELHISVYDEDRHKGCLRHVVGRVGTNGDLMVCLVTATPKLPHAKELIKILRTRLPRMVSLQQNIQTYHNNVIMGRDTVLLWGKKTIKDQLGRLEFHISPRSFFQVNTEQAEVLYAKALEYANLKGEETVIDAYCGTGTITLYLARKAAKAYGVEIVKPAIEDARQNAYDNHIKNVEFQVGDATKILPVYYKKGLRPDVIVVDPPRAGCTEKVLQTFAAMQPERIVYVSCNPATLARDIAILEPLGYKPIKAQPVDMFPMTAHVETVCLMSRENRGFNICVPQ